MRARILAARDLILASGQKPSIRRIAAVLDAAGGGVRWSLISSVMEEAGVSAPTGNTGQQAATVLSTTGNTGQQAATETLPLFTGKVSSGKEPRLDVRTTYEIVADLAIEQLRPRIEPRLSGMTWTQWKQRNRRCAVDMAQAGMDAKAICAAQERAGSLSLRVVQDRLNSAPALAPRAVSVKFGLEDPKKRAQFTAAAREKQAKAATPETAKEDSDFLSSLGFTLDGKRSAGGDPGP